MLITPELEYPLVCVGVSKGSDTTHTHMLLLHAPFTTMIIDVLRDTYANLVLFYISGQTETTLSLI